MAKAKAIKEEKVDIVKDLFVIHEEFKSTLTKDEEEYLEEIREELYKIVEEEGTIGQAKIKEVVLDDLTREEYDNLIKYLGLEIEVNIEEALEEKIKDENFLKVEETEGSEDFFNNYLKDDTINDLIMTLLGYDRRSEGAKERFIKKRSAKIPTDRIYAIQEIFISRFNKIEFLSQKEDEEQAKLIMLAYALIFDIL